MKNLPLGLKVLLIVNASTGILLSLLCLASIIGHLYNAFMMADKALAADLGLALCSLVFIGAFAAIFIFAARDIHKLKKVVIRNQGGINFLFTLAAMGVLALATFVKQSQIARQGFCDIGILNVYHAIVAILLILVVWSFIYIRLPRIKKILVN